jgi:hypothetical protein
MLKAALLALALAGAGASAHAAPLFDAYQGFCVKPAADASSGIAAATAAGWSPIPDAILQQLSGAMGIQKANGRMRSDSAGLSFMFVGAKQLPVGAITLDLRFCAVATTGAIQPGELTSALAAWTATPSSPALSKNGQVGYVFLDQGGAHKAVSNPNDAAAMALINSGDMRFAFVQESQKINLLAFAVPTL